MGGIRRKKIRRHSLPVLMRVHPDSAPRRAHHDVMYGDRDLPSAVPLYLYRDECLCSR